MLALGTILYPTDFSERSRSAFQLACALARDHGARLILLHVAGPAVLYGEGLTVLPTESYHEQLRERLQGLQAQAPKGVVELRVCEGDAAGEILRVADETKCDLIVMGTHGWTGLGRLLMGSVAEKVVRKAPCPVLTLRTPFPPAASATAQPAGRSLEVSTT
jgi:nucleotide-binding universal stress UspA family protein